MAIRDNIETSRAYMRRYMVEVYLPKKRREKKLRERETKARLKSLAPPALHGWNQGAVYCAACDKSYPADNHRLSHPDLLMLKWVIHQHIDKSIFTVMDEPIELENDEFVAVLSMTDARDAKRGWSHTGPYASGKYAETPFRPVQSWRKKKTPEPDLTA